MNSSKCPHCGAALGKFFYADVCPHCHEELKHNTKRLIPARVKDPHKAQPWPLQIFFRTLRIVES